MYQAALAGTAREHPGGGTDHRRPLLGTDRNSRRRIIEGGLEQVPAENVHLGASIDLGRYPRQAPQPIS